MREAVRIIEVGPRDGLQNEPLLSCVQQLLGTVDADLTFFSKLRGNTVNVIPACTSGYCNVAGVQRHVATLNALGCQRP